MALSGDGGDEVFAGYRRYRWHLLVEAVRRHLPGPVRRSAIAGLARLYPKLDRAPRFLRARHTLTELSLDTARGFAATVTKLQARQRRALFAPSLRAALDGHDPMARFDVLLDEAADAEPLAQAQYIDLQTWLPGDILVKVDRASMANSLEVRAPFLDPALVGFGLSLPAAQKIVHGAGKHMLRQALAPLLPQTLLDRPKQGFASSPAALFRAEAARLRARLLGPVMGDSGLFQPAAIARLIDEHAADAYDHSQKLWLLLVFEGFLAAEMVQTEPTATATAAVAGA